MWNGYSRNLVTKQGGASRVSILTMNNGIVTRGVLYDIARLKGVDYWEPGTRIFPSDLEAWAGSPAVLGVHILDRADLEALGEAAATRNRFHSLALALAMLYGCVVVISLRLMGILTKGWTVAGITREVTLFLNASLAVILTSGTLLYLSEAMKAFDDGAFWIKDGLDRGTDFPGAPGSVSDVRAALSALYKASVLVCRDSPPISLKAPGRSRTPPLRTEEPPRTAGKLRPQYCARRSPRSASS
jgi:hypothetical protein